MYKNRLITYIALVAVLVYACWKARIGVHSDEMHTIAVGDMISRGNTYFKETWFYLQMSTVFNAPLIYLFRLVTGSLDGIVYFIRVVTIFIQALCTAYFYNTFSKVFSKNYVLVAAIMFFIYTPDFLSLIYKQEVIWCALLIICFCYKYYESGLNRYSVLLGLCTACSVLAYPTSAIFVLFIIGLFIYCSRVRDESLQKTAKSIGLFITVCAICGAIFLAYIFATIGIKNFLHYFTIVFMDGNLDRNFATKWLYPLFKMFIMGGIAFIPCVIVQRCKIVNKVVLKYHIPIMTILVILAFAGQTYIEKACITWHVINYPYSLTPFVCLWLGKMMDNEKEKITSMVFFWMTWGVILSMLLASNQGNITGMYGTVFTAMLLVMQMGTSTDVNEETCLFGEKRKIAVSLLVIALLTFIFPVYEHESTTPINDSFSQTNIFTAREIADYGPLKGIYLNKSVNDMYNSICSTIDENVHEGDSLCIIDTYATSFGCLYSDAENALYSPQGGVGIKDTDRIVEYYRENPQKVPTVVLLNKDYIGVTYEEYILSTPFGNYLDKNGYRLRNENEEYWILSKD